MNCSNTYSICLSQEYNVYITGEDITSNSNIVKLKQINNLRNISSFACGTGHIICCDFDGIVYSIGKANDNGELGIGHFKSNKTNRVNTVNICPIREVFCGLNFTICLDYNNGLWGFGSNRNAQLGLGNNTSYHTPQQIPNIFDVELVSCGAYFVICKTLDGYYSWGYGSYGQLGLGEEKECKLPKLCSKWPDIDVKSIKSGHDHTLLLTTDGFVYSFGFNGENQLGTGNKNNVSSPVIISDLPEIQLISCGYKSSYCIDIDNNLWVFGWNSYGQLGLGDTKSRISPELLKDVHDIIDLSFGAFHLFFKTKDGEIYAMGNNSKSQIGLSNTPSTVNPIKVFSCKNELWYSQQNKSRAKSARK